MSRRIETLREKVLGDMDILRLRAIWRIGELAASAATPEDDEDVMRRLHMTEGFGDEDQSEESYQEEGEEEEDEAAKWLKQQEEKKLQEEEQVTRMDKIRGLGDTEPKTFQSSRFGKVSLSVNFSAKWPEDPGAPPDWSPLSNKDLSSREALTVVFQKPETWEALQQMSSSPRFAQFIQDWLLPKVTLLIGRNWWNQNKGSPQLKGAPFGLFDDDTRVQYRESLDSHPQGRAWIFVIQTHIARLLAQYLATKGPGPKENIAGYINIGLQRAMVTAAGRSHDRIRVNLPVCGFCKHSYRLKAPPELKRDPATGLYRCPQCAEEIQLKEDEVRQKLAEVQESHQDADYLRNQISIMEEQGMGENFKIKTHRIRLNQLEQGMADKERELEDSRRELNIRRVMAEGVPTPHVVCINEECPGQKIPLSFIDWTGPFWSTEEGSAARKYLEKQYGVVELGKERQYQDIQKAEDEWESASRKSGYRPPPKEIWNVPFICPYDGIRFTPVEAKGKGPVARNSGRRLGGLFVDPPRKQRMIAAPIMERDVPSRRTSQPSGEGLKFEDLYDAEGDKINLNPERAEEHARAKVEFDRKFQEIYRTLLARQKAYQTLIRDEDGSLKPVSRKKQQKHLLQEALYDAVVDWSADNRLDFIAWLYDRTPRSRNVYDRYGDFIASVTEFHVLEPDRATQVKASIIHKWFGRLIHQFSDLLPGSQRQELESRNLGTWNKGIDLLTYGKSWLTTEKSDNLPSVTYFLSKVEPYSSEYSIVKSRLRYGKGMPMGDTSPRNRAGTKRATYGNNPRIAVVYGAWDYRNRKADEAAMASPIKEKVGDGIAAGLRSINVSVAYADFRAIYLRNDENMGLSDGDTVLIKASFMLDQGGIVPIRMIDNLYKEMKEALK